MQQVSACITLYMLKIGERTECFGLHLHATWVVNIIYTQCNQTQCTLIIAHARVSFTGTNSCEADVTVRAAVMPLPSWRLYKCKSKAPGPHWNRFSRRYRTGRSRSRKRLWPGSSPVNWTAPGSGGCTRSSAGVYRRPPVWWIEF